MYRTSSSASFEAPDPVRVVSSTGKGTTFGKLFVQGICALWELGELVPGSIPAREVYYERGQGRPRDSPAVCDGLLEQWER